MGSTQKGWKRLLYTGQSRCGRPDKYCIKPEIDKQILSPLHHHNDNVESTRKMLATLSQVAHNWQWLTTHSQAQQKVTL